MGCKKSVNKKKNFEIDNHVWSGGQGKYMNMLPSLGPRLREQYQM
jgi:hypothetical protein